ncbi:hypothetical protein GW17_00005108 [Ensete ventricosum]|nr:hypothetical protein GW17_00005108 [Ensete ventricosum]
MARGRPPGGVAARAARDGGNRPSMTEIDRRRPILVLPPGSGRSAYRSAAGPEVNRIHCCCSTTDPRELGHQDQSPLSILENSFSTESCYSSESFENTDGNNRFVQRLHDSSFDVFTKVLLLLKLDGAFPGSRTDWYYSSILVEDIVEMVCIDKTLSAEREMELSDLASSNKQIIDLGLVSEIGTSDRAETLWGGLVEDIVEMVCIDKTLSAEREMELSETLSSSNKQIIDLGLVSEIGTSDRAETLWGGLEYVKEILTISEFIVDDLIPYFMDQSDEIFDPLLFEKLEENQSLTACEIAERHRRMRKIIFDAVNECLETKHSHYFRAGFRMWSKGVVLAAKDLSHELYNEISGWNSIEDLMVDELVAKDMSTYLGRWIDFEIEAFEAGVEIQMWLFNTLVDEVVADFQINDPQDI